MKKRMGTRNTAARIATLNDRKQPLKVPKLPDDPNCCKRMRLLQLKSIGVALLFLEAVMFQRPALTAEPIKNQGAFVHEYSHFSFPTNVGAAERVSLDKYDKEGRDVSAGYNLRSPMMTVTVYVYPAPKNFALLPQKQIGSVTEAVVKRHFEQVKGDVQRRHSDAQVLSEGAFELTQEQKTRKGRRVMFTFEDRFAGLKQSLYSELYLFVLEPDTMLLINERFFVKFRVTYPAAEKESAEKELQKFLKALIWPTK
jgi:hypothetical protein